MLDAKYVDLAGQSMPRAILYQLAIYALSRESGGTATILYPTLQNDLREARIEIRDPIQNHRQGLVIARPVNMINLESLVSLPYGQHSERRRSAFAQLLAFGHGSAL
jgi:5-methylcytosine-specific restriction enzyme subunit McrC